MKLKNKFQKLNASSRIYGLDIPVIALTGGIATGKSTVADLFLKKKIPLLDADKLVKIVYKDQDVLNYLSINYKEVIINSVIDFRKLREFFFSNQQTKSNIEHLIYSKLPAVFRSELKLLGNPSFIMYDIPLLFEKKLEDMFDQSLLVYTTAEIQIERLMKRDNHSLEEAQNIINHQISIEDKKKRADLIISNTSDFTSLENQVEKLCDQLFE